MTCYYEVLTNTEEANIKSNKIDTLLGYPNGYGTANYREIFPHPIDDRVVAIVDERLIEACEDMSDEERLQYYNQANLKTLEEVNKMGWFIDESDI